jgi:hypothetical protein
MRPEISRLHNVRISEDVNLIVPLHKVLIDRRTVHTECHDHEQQHRYKSPPCRIFLHFPRRLPFRARQRHFIPHPSTVSSDTFYTARVRLSRLSSPISISKWRWGWEWRRQSETLCIYAIPCSSGWAGGGFSFAAKMGILYVVVP